MDCETLLAVRHLGISIRRHIDRLPVQEELIRLTGPSCWILEYLADHEYEDIYQRDLEREFRLCRSTASKMLAALESGGFVVRERVLHDDRLKKITLTPRAKQYTEQIRENNRKTEQALIRGLTPEELRTLHSLMERMQRNLTEQS